jgi:hypothetical protein
MNYAIIIIDASRLQPGPGYREKYPENALSMGVFRA